MNLQGDLDIPNDVETFLLTPVAEVVESARKLIFHTKQANLSYIERWMRNLENDLDAYDAWLEGETPNG
jgi:hypothetical protein